MGAPLGFHVMGGGLSERTVNGTNDCYFSIGVDIAHLAIVVAASIPFLGLSHKVCDPFISNLFPGA